MLRFASWNVNGIRACTKNGFVDWLQNSDMDVVGLQEVRAEADQIPNEVRELKEWDQHWFPCQRKKGYSGVGILTRVKPLNVVRSVGIEEIDCEGRIIAAEFKDCWFASIYFPNSGDAGARLDYKIRFCRALHPWLDKLRAKGKPVIVTGDYNIAHQPIDLARPKENEQTSGYLPEERAWMTEFLGHGWVDTFRTLHPDKVLYSWWSQRMRARERNVGWRIDYHCVHEKDRKLIKTADILPDVKGSDHCPVTLVLDI
ncbi:MAG: exodeoxyribonuclease III [Bdellovibrionales bacterium]|nr:exodeoxyribonuclease III [Bdellovibrionales bacterium]